MTDTLWPDFDVRQAPPTPKTIIEQAGAGLETKTNGIVRFYRSGLSVKDNQVEVAFTLYSPPLGYHYPFLRATFSVERSYPVTVVADRVGEIVANDEKELVATLTRIFNAPSTIDTIQRLMSLAKQ